jgi:hypothetical protein
MTDVPETNDLDSRPQTHLPPGPPAPRPMGVRFFLWLGVCLALPVAGALVFLFGPQIWPKHKPQPPVAAVTAQPAAPAQPAALQARIAELQQELDDAHRAEAAAGAVAVQGAATQALNQRLDRIEAYERKAGRAASAAVAAGALADAAQTSRPFAGELDALQRLMPDSSLVAGLRPLAQAGAPTRAALAAEFPAVAARAATAARQPRRDAGLIARALAALSTLITLRRVDDLTGGSPDAILARAEQRVNDGDIEGALLQMRALPPRALAATADWRERAQRRVAIEAGIASLRTEALRDLVNDAPPAGPAS